MTSHPESPGASDLKTSATRTSTGVRQTRYEQQVALTAASEDEGNGSRPVDRPIAPSRVRDRPARNPAHRGRTRRALGCSITVVAILVAGIGAPAWVPSPRKPGAGRLGRLPLRARPARISCRSRNSSSVRSRLRTERQSSRIASSLRRRRGGVHQRPGPAAARDRIRRGVAVASSHDRSPPVFPVVPAECSISALSRHRVPPPSKPRCLPTTAILG